MVTVPVEGAILQVRRATLRMGQVIFMVNAVNGHIREGVATARVPISGVIGRLPNPTIATRNCIGIVVMQGGTLSSQSAYE